MKLRAFLAILSFFVVAALSISTLVYGAEKKVQLTIVDNGKSQYSIVVPSRTRSVDSMAARELQNYIFQISGALLPIVGDSAKESRHEILIGTTKRSSRLVSGFHAAALEEDGFTLKTVGQKVLILGGGRKGTLFGVYTLLEDQLGCRMYSATVTVIPKRTSIILPGVNTTQVPYIRFRELHYLNAMDRSYSDWHKLHSLADQQESWGMWVHTFGRLVPPDKYFAQHPEYFSLIGGHRVPSGQLCLSNPDVLGILTKSLQEYTARMPAAHTWSVSQNDNFNECQCDSCRALNALYGGSSGTMIAFVNRVARQFPDKDISTLAYQYTRSAPTGVKPDPNVNIMLCSIECNRSEPIATDPRSASFRKDVTDWGNLTDNILMWDYVVQFRNLDSPFPNLRVLQPNIQFFVKNHIRKMFQQGAGSNVAEFGELRTYLIAKLLWNPNCDISAVMDDFLNGYYGAAGRYIRTYIDKMHDALQASGGTLDIYGYPYDAIKTYLTPELLKEYSELFDKAENAVRDTPEVLERVKNARLPLEFAILDISSHDVNSELSYFDKQGTHWVPKQSMQKRLEAFVAQAKKAGIQRLEEHGRPPDEYLQSMNQQMHVSVEGNLAYGKPVTLLTTPSDKYPAGGAQALTNGLHGPNDYHNNWLGFEEQNLDAIIDLGKDTTFSTVAAGFLQQWYAWIWMPLKVDVAVSSDGKQFTTVGSMPNDVPDTTDGVFQKEFRLNFAPQHARYVRVTAQSRLHCPDWHLGAGQKCWMFVDEVVVQ